MNKITKSLLIGGLVLVGACSCSIGGKTLHCTQHLDMFGFVADEDVDINIGDGKINNVVMKESFDLAAMIEQGSTEDEVNAWAEEYKETSDEACEDYKDCNVSVDYKKGKKLVVSVKIGGADFEEDTSLDISDKSKDEIYDELKTELEAASYTCK